MMGVGLQPLEFADCLADTPQFRENLHRHEKELEKTSQQIKRLIKEVKDVVQAARRLRSAQLALASSMEQLEGCGADDESSLSEDERAISRALGHFAHLLRNVEDERDRMLENAQMQIIEPLERFRKEHVGAVKEGKKKFDKKTSKFNQTQERTLALSMKKPDGVWVEAEAAMEMASRDFCAASLRYVWQLQALQRRRHFEVGEALLGFVFSWWTFHHSVHEIRADAEPLARDTQLRIQRARGNFEESSKQTESLMKKMMEIRLSSSEEDGSDENGNKSGYLFLMEKKAFGTTWSRQYACFDSSVRVLSLTPYSQNNPKAPIDENGSADGEGLKMTVAEARVPMDAERRFTMEVTSQQLSSTPLLLQAPSERARASWLKAMNQEANICATLEPKWIKFISALLEQIERKAINETGLYRVGGVRSRVLRMLALGNEGRPVPDEADVRTLTSAVKAYLRALPEPLLTQKLHREWCYAARLTGNERLVAIKALIARLPKENKRLLSILVRHLRVIVSNASINLMTCGNVAVCVGPALLPHGDSMAAVLDVKTYNSLLETMIEQAHLIFNEEDMPPPPPPLPEDLATPSLPLHHGSRTDISPRYGPSHLCLVRQLGHSSRSPSESPSPPPQPPLRRGARVRTLYACLGESEGELSFEPNQVINNVAPSAEPGWLRGELQGRVGLVPENYVEPLP